MIYIKKTYKKHFFYVLRLKSKKFILKKCCKITTLIKNRVKKKKIFNAKPANLIIR